MAAPALSLVDVGNGANDGTGDSLRDAFIRINQDLQSLYNAIQAIAGGTITDVDGQVKSVADAIAQRVTTSAFNQALAGKQTASDALTALATVNSTTFGRGLLTLSAISDLANALGLGDAAALDVASDADAKAGTSTVLAITPETLKAVLVNLLTQPGVLSGYLPTTQPSQSNVPWRNNGFLAFS